MAVVVGNFYKFFPIVIFFRFMRINLSCGVHYEKILGTCTMIRYTKMNDVIINRKHISIYMRQDRITHHHA